MGFKCRSWQHIVLMGAFVALLQGCGGAPAGQSSSTTTTTPTTGTGSNGSGTATPNDSTGEETISFTSNSADQIVIRGQGGNETSVVNFRVATIGGTAVADRNISFEISNTLGGARLLSDTGTTDASGNVSTTIQSGTVAAAIRVTATLADDKTAVSSEVQISTSTFIASSFPLTADGDDVVAPFAGIDAIDPSITGPYLLVEEASNVAGVEVGLQMIATDQFGHRVLNGSAITIVSPETGLVEPARCVFTAGVCRATFFTNAGVSPYSLVSVMAYANGAEAFTDQNGNNIFDMGEPFTDLGEPFVDENDNGTYDLGEFFVDADSNGMYDSAGNGEWDGPCLTEPNLCPGEDSTIISSTLTLRLLPIEAPTPTPTPMP